MEAACQHFCPFLPNSQVVWLFVFACFSINQKQRFPNPHFQGLSQSKTQGKVISSAHLIHNDWTHRRVSGGAFTHFRITLSVRPKVHIRSIQRGTSFSKTKPTNRTPGNVPSSFQHPGFNSQNLRGPPRKSSVPAEGAVTNSVNVLLGL